VKYLIFQKIGVELVVIILNFGLGLLEILNKQFCEFATIFDKSFQKIIKLKENNYIT